MTEKRPQGRFYVWRASWIEHGVCYIAHRLFNDSTVERTDRANDSMSNIQLDIEWTEAASRKIEKLMPRNVNKDSYLALPPVECLPMEGDVLFLGPSGKQQPFIVAERQYHHDGDADWTIILILDVPHETH
jgi:hypothetical protein